MCDMCRQTPCDNRCPNAWDAFYIVGTCYKCDDYLYSNCTHWKDDEGHEFCSKECAEDFYGIKEVDE